jgi:GTP-binding protein Era
MKTGYVAIIGRPNVGKSTLLNHLLGQKISITSRRPQTTRHRIHGIKTTPEGQAIFVDTPGIHFNQKRAMNRYLNQTAGSALVGVDLIVWLIDRLAWLPEDNRVLELIKGSQAIESLPPSDSVESRLPLKKPDISPSPSQREGGEVPVILAINKIDWVKDKSLLLPFLKETTERYPFADLIPISALKNDHLDLLEKKIMALLPEGDPIYPEDQLTDRPERFFVAEIIREKLLRCLGQEVPHALTVEIEQFKTEGHLVKIHALIWVEREGQKAIVIGQKGEVLKKVGERARHDLEQMLESKVYLELWVKVKKGWSDDERALQSLGYVE